LKNQYLGLIVFTKDRLSTLERTLSTIRTKGPVIIIDDSTTAVTQQEIKKKSNEMNNLIYHGKKEQKEIYNLLKKKYLRIDSFIKPLGLRSWNLGYVRNYAILLCKLFKINKVLFMDDDIIVEDKFLFRKLFQILNNYNFTGSQITGMVDDSVLGHIKRSLGQPSWEFLSGGFMAFNLASITEYFLNYYNEDWIWLHLHMVDDQICKFGEVKQLPFNPIENGIDKAKQQEFGEILVIGVQNACESNNIDRLLNSDFWKDIIHERIDELTSIINLNNKRKKVIDEICNSLIDYNQNINDEKYVNIWRDYFEKRSTWRWVLEDLNNTNDISIMRNNESWRGKRV